MHSFRPLARYVSAAFTALLLVIALAGQRAAAARQVSIGVVPAEIVKGPSSHSAGRCMLGRIPRGPHEYHIVAAIFDTATRARVFNTNIDAQVSGLSLSGTKKKLEPMQIAGTTTYGSFFDFLGFDLYTVRLTIDRPGASQPIVLDFKHGHRR